MTNSTFKRSTRRGRRLRTHCAKGFTLVETMIALVVLSLGVLALASLMPMGTKKISNSASRTRASELAATLAERLLSTPYADSALVAGSHTDDESPYEGQYYLSWSVEDDQPISACKRVTVYARWPTSTSSQNARVVVVTPRAGG
jgi:type IV pilus assembly protein PilV